MMSLAEYLRLRAELRSLLNSWEYAYAMGHGCTMNGRDPRLQPVVDRVNALETQIREAEEEARRHG